MEIFFIIEFIRGSQTVGNPELGYVDYIFFILNMTRCLGWTDNEIYLPRQEKEAQNMACVLRHSL